MLLPETRISLLLVAQICCSKHAVNFPTGKLMGYITVFAYCVSRGWAAAGLQPGV